MIVAHRRNVLLNALKHCKRCSQIGVIGNAYRYRALYVHVFYCMTERATKQVIVVNLVALTTFSRRLKSAVPCGGFYGRNTRIPTRAWAAGQRGWPAARLDQTVSRRRAVSCRDPQRRGAASPGGGAGGGRAPARVAASRLA